MDKPITTTTAERVPLSLAIERGYEINGPQIKGRYFAPVQGGTDTIGCCAIGAALLGAGIVSYPPSITTPRPDYWVMAVNYWDQRDAYQCRLHFNCPITPPDGFRGHIVNIAMHLNDHHGMEWKEIVKHLRRLSQ